jgi:hypothetical protein
MYMRSVPIEDAFVRARHRQREALLRLAQSFLGALALGDVAQVSGEKRRALRRNAGHRQLDRKFAAVRAHRGHFGALAEHLTLAALQVACQALSVLRTQPRRDDELGELLPQRLGASVAESALGRRVELHDPSLVVDADDAVERGFEHRRLARLALAQSLLSLLARRDVPADAAVAAELALLVEDRRAAHADVAQHPVRPDARALQLAERLARRQHRLVLRPGTRQGRHVLELPARLADRRLPGVSGQIIGLCRKVGKAQVLVLLPVPVGGKRGQAAEARFARAQRVGGELAVGDVGGGARPAHRLAGGIAQAHGDHVHPAQVAARQDPQLQVKARGFAGVVRLPRGLEFRSILRVERILGEKFLAAR